MPPFQGSEYRGGRTPGATRVPRAAARLAVLAFPFPGLPCECPFGAEIVIGLSTSTAVRNGRSVNRVGVKRRREFQGFPTVRR